MAFTNTETAAGRRTRPPQNKRKGGENRTQTPVDSGPTFFEIFADGLAVYNASGADDGFHVEARFYTKVRNQQTRNWTRGTMGGKVEGILHVEYDLESGDPSRLVLNGASYSPAYLAELKVLIGRKVAPPPKVPVIKEIAAE